MESIESLTTNPIPNSSRQSEGLKIILEYKVCLLMVLVQYMIFEYWPLIVPVWHILCVLSLIEVAHPSVAKCEMKKPFLKLTMENISI